MTYAQRISQLQTKIADAAAAHHRTGGLTDRLVSLRTEQLKRELTMTYDEMARDAQRRLDIVDSCRLIKSHASYVGVTAQEVVRLPTEYTPAAMDELNEAAGVLERALGRVLDAKERLLSKAENEPEPVQ